MRKLIIEAVLILVLAVFSMNVWAQTLDGMTPAEEGICNFLKTDRVTKRLYGLCVAFCEAHDAPADVTAMTEEDLKKSDPASLALFDLYERKRGESGPELPCVNYDGACPVWTQKELDRIGTLGGGPFHDIETNSGGSENYLDAEFVSRFMHYAQVIKSGTNLSGKYFSSAPDFPNANRHMELTEAEYNACKQQLIDHVTKPELLSTTY